MLPQTFVLIHRVANKHRLSRYRSLGISLPGYRPRAARKSRAIRITDRMDVDGASKQFPLSRCTRGTLVISHGFARRVQIHRWTFVATKRNESSFFFLSMIARDECFSATTIPAVTSSLQADTGRRRSDLEQLVREASADHDR